MPCHSLQYKLQGSKVALRMLGAFGKTAVQSPIRAHDRAVSTGMQGLDPDLDVFCYHRDFIIRMRLESRCQLRRHRTCSCPRQCMWWWIDTCRSGRVCTSGMIGGPSSTLLPKVLGHGMNGLKTVVACGCTWVPAKSISTLPAEAGAAMKGLKWMISCGCNGMIGGPSSILLRKVLGHGMNGLKSVVACGCT
jgi:hypothetical protein